MTLMREAMATNLLNNLGCGTAFNRQQLNSLANLSQKARSESKSGPKERRRGPSRRPRVQQMGAATRSPAPPNPRDITRKSRRLQ